MRYLMLLPLLGIAACSASAPRGPAPGTFVGAGRDWLCIAGEGEGLRAGLIVYAAGGDANCTAVGRLEASGERWTLTPKGEDACKLILAIDGDRLAIAGVSASCNYYCGPGASLPGKTFTRDAEATAVDLAGDPLCG